MLEIQGLADKDSIAGCAIFEGVKLSALALQITGRGDPFVRRLVWIGPVDWPGCFTPRVSVKPWIFQPDRILLEVENCPLIGPKRRLKP